jgi:hypothetical protein
LKIYTTFKDVQMILKRFYDISTGFRFSKNQCECSVHSYSCPWLNVQYDLKTQGLNILTIVSYNRDMSIHGCAEQLLSSIYGMYLGCITLIQPYTILYANNSNLTFVFCCRWDRNIVVARETSNWGQSG